MIEKPPLGVIPKLIHDENRLRDLSEAIIRYVNTLHVINMKWIDEYNQLCLQHKRQQIADSMTTSLNNIKEL